MFAEFIERVVAMPDLPPSLWSSERLSPGKDVGARDNRGHRTPHEQDYDRILFSTSVRRLADKTQVFPLDTNDAVRTRLTHSHEVANLARSIGARIHTVLPSAFEDQDLYRVVLPLLGAAGLAHDLGNPPFGHQGEAAISSWFSRRKEWIFDRKKEGSGEAAGPIEEEYRNEFLAFDGNPQSLRVLARLHTSQGGVGLDLTAGTIMALMKYPVGAQNVEPDHPARKKFGYFASEAFIVDWARRHTGLSEGQRHPLAWIVEASDDSAYSVLDVEDAMKKGIISPDDLLNILKCCGEVCNTETFQVLSESFEKAEALPRTPSIIRDIKIGYARSYLIDALVRHASDTFVDNHADIYAFEYRGAIMDSSHLCEALKKVARDYAFGNSEVLHAEAWGRHALEELMDFFWLAISERKLGSDIVSKRSSAIARYVYSLISDNYLEASMPFPLQTHATAERERYRELRLLTDMVSGMTDGFTLRLDEKIKEVV